jgi:hypothetical protein
MEFNLNQVATDVRLREFADKIQILSEKIGFKVSARGWAYQLESERLINKDEFDKVESWINTCRKKGILPLDFTAEEEGRKFSGVEEPDDESPIKFMSRYVNASLTAENLYTPDWWDGEEYYIQMLVEKIDLKTLFNPVCERFHIPVATSKGWSSMLQRGVYARRFKEAENKGLKPVLLYCGDFDPDGLRISEFIRKNLEDIKDIVWEDGETGYDPEGLTIIRFGLNHDFIEEHKLTWINNLITGSGKNLASSSHKNNAMPYVQAYIKNYCVRKCEANAIVPMPVIARRLVENAITDLIGDDAEDRFAEKRENVKEELDEFRKRTGLDKSLKKALDIIRKE